MPKLIIFSLILFSTIVYSQYPPIASPNTLNKKHYPIWLKANKHAFRGLEYKGESVTIKSDLWGWNLFLSYAILFPKDPNDILIVFNERVKYEPYRFCYNYSEYFHSKFKSVKSFYPYYSKQIKKMNCICDSINLEKNSTLNAKLKEIRKSDQQYRSKGISSSRYLQTLQEELDSINLFKIDKIILEHGYPGRNLIGLENETVAFLVIHHSTLEIMKKYLPLIFDAVEAKHLDESAYAYLHDRIAILEGIPQLYGTQSHYDDDLGKEVYYDLADTENLNRRRYKMNLKQIDGFPRVRYHDKFGFYYSSIKR